MSERHWWNVAESAPERHTEINGPPLCRCGRPCKCYFPRCEECWLEATRLTSLDVFNRRPRALIGLQTEEA